jgi:phage protein D
VQVSSFLRIQQQEGGELIVLKPTYAVMLGSFRLASDHLAPLVALRVDRAKNAGADWATVTIGRVQAVSVSAGDPATVELGWDGDTTLVFTGQVEAVTQEITGTTVTAAGSQMTLIRARSDRTFTRQSAGQVVSALAGDAGVETGTVEDGIDLPAYHVDSARRAWEHCLGLARRCGFDCYANADGTLVFAPFTTLVADKTFRYAAEVLSASLQRWRPGGGATVVPESPASGQGDDTSAWLVKDPSPYQGEAGDPATLVVSDPLLRTKEAADSAAAGLVAFWQRQVITGDVELMGDPDVTLGQAIALSGMPDDSWNDTYQVLAVRHVLDDRRGFRTQAGLGGMPGGLPGALGGLP